MVTIDGEKMSKSVGNVKSVRTVPGELGRQRDQTVLSVRALFQAY